MILESRIYYLLHADNYNRKKKLAKWMIYHIDKNSILNIFFQVVMSVCVRIIVVNPPIFHVSHSLPFFRHPWKMITLGKGRPCLTRQNCMTEIERIQTKISYT